MPKIDKDSAPRYERQAYPGRLLQRTKGCWKTKLSDAIGLDQIGVGEVTLAPGSATGLLHWHEAEDEMVYILSGEVVLVEEESGEQVLRAGDCAGWKGGAANGHTLENRSNAPAVLLEIGVRISPYERAHYVGLDLTYNRRGKDISFETRDGRPVSSDQEVDELPAKR